MIEKIDLEYFSAVQKTVEKIVELFRDIIPNG